MSPPTIRPASDHSVLVSFGDELSLDHHQNVRRLTERLIARKQGSFRNIQPAYCSVLITFDPSFADYEEVRMIVDESLKAIESVPIAKPGKVEIPVCYGEDLGPDLDEVARISGLKTDEVIRLHSGGDYTVYFFGFSPGFPYLGGLPRRLNVPRVSTPRKTVPAGSVAIAGYQAGIYPVRSPGGWRILGRTPLKLFDAQTPQLTYLKMGDEVKFSPITRNQFDRMSFEE